MCPAQDLAGRLLPHYHLALGAEGDVVGRVRLPVPELADARDRLGEARHATCRHVLGQRRRVYLEVGADGDSARDKLAQRKPELLLQLVQRDPGRLFAHLDGEDALGCRGLEVASNVVQEYRLLRRFEAEVFEDEVVDLRVWLPHSNVSRLDHHVKELHHRVERRGEGVAARVLPVVGQRGCLQALGLDALDRHHHFGTRRRESGFHGSEQFRDVSLEHQPRCRKLAGEDGKELLQSHLPALQPLPGASAASLGGHREDGAGGYAGVLFESADGGHGRLQHHASQVKNDSAKSRRGRGGHLPRKSGCCHASGNSHCLRQRLQPAQHPSRSHALGPAQG
mmetsp:Transcript_16818/g.40550  ORF Transcript_16818/g.40550 Transcript_16818/m.40550 type:complete len:338 (-) Transcript_16818:7-1020(-)